MTNNDTCCSFAPYFKIHQGQMDAFRSGCEAFVEKTSMEPGCLFYGFSFSGDEAHCREGYKDAEALIDHLGNVAALIDEALKISDITRVEVHGPESQLALLREPLAGLNPQFFRLELGFRR
jgi:quinol monooxygenase YgiN